MSKTSISRIDKENIIKRRKVRLFFVGTLIYLLFVVYVLDFLYIWNITRRPQVGDVLVQTLLQLFSKTTVHAITGLSPVEYLLLGCISLFVASVVAILISKKKLRAHDNSTTVNGSAKLMDQNDLDEYNKRRSDPLGSTKNDGANNMILSRDIFLSLDGFQTKRNCNILVIGGSGAGKTRYFAAPNLLQYNTNFLFTDPSGELLANYGKALENNGYTVKVFNLVNVYKSNKYNPFHYIKEEKDVFILVNTLLKNTNPSEGKSSDPFWEKCEKLLLQALILYLWHNVPEEEQTFENVIKLIDMASVDENDASAESMLDKLFNALANEDPNNLAALEYRNFKKAAGKTLKSIIISVVARMESFMLSDIQYLTSADEMEFEKFADSKQALFVIIPTADTTFNFIVSLMYAQMFMTLYEYVETRAEFGHQAVYNGRSVIRVEQAASAEESVKAKNTIDALVKNIKNGMTVEHDKVRNVYNIYTIEGHELVTWRGTEKDAELVRQQLQTSIVAKPCGRFCANHVRLILDEFANIGSIPDFNEKLATIRKYNISCSIILQALSQLKKMYKDDWNTIVANCDTKLFLGCDDSETIEWLVKMLGKRTTTVENLSLKAHGEDSESYNKSSIDLLTVDQVSQMSDTDCVVRVRGENPYYGPKYDLLAHPKYAEAQETSGTFILPGSNAKERNTHIPLRLRKSYAAAEAARLAEENDTENKIMAKAEKDLPAEGQKAVSSTGDHGSKNDLTSEGIPVKGKEPRLAEITQQDENEKISVCKNAEPMRTQFSDRPATDNSIIPSETSKKRKPKNNAQKNSWKKNQDMCQDFQNQRLSEDEMEAVQTVLDAANIPTGASEKTIVKAVESLVHIPETPNTLPTYKMTD